MFLTFALLMVIYIIVRTLFILYCMAWVFITLSFCSCCFVWSWGICYKKLLFLNSQSFILAVRNFITGWIHYLLVALLICENAQMLFISIFIVTCPWILDVTFIKKLSFFWWCYYAHSIVWFNFPILLDHDFSYLSL